MTTIFEPDARWALFWSHFLFTGLFAALTSEFAAVETWVANIKEMSIRKVSQQMKATTIVAVVAFLLGIPLGFSYSGAFGDVHIVGMTIFEIADYIANNIFLMIGPLAMILYLPIKWRWNNFMTDINTGIHEGTKVQIYNWMKPLFCIVLPLWMVYLVLSMFGIF